DSDAAVAARAAKVFEQRARGEATVPTTVAQEKATNPFLRAPMLIPDVAPAQAFARMRSAKDAFRG
ncbi:MAG: hydroxyacylglutathione hydrolase, partial [Caulobacteraceae bacterium]|nr:hydroxyacylglutathione hydrolase [Caulobacteraceae bacterium]